MKKFIVVLLIIGAFLAGGFIGNILKFKWLVPQRQEQYSVPHNQDQLMANDTVIKNLNRKLDEIVLNNESLRQKLNSLESTSHQANVDYEQRLNKEKQTRLKVEEELNKLKAVLPAPEVISSTDKTEAKPKKKNPFVQSIAKNMRMQIEKQFKNRLKILKEKAFLSAYQENELSKLTDETIEKKGTWEEKFNEELFSGEPFSDEFNEFYGEGAEIDEQYKQKLKELLTPQQYSVYEQILKEERKEEIARTVKRDMDGITEPLELSQEQQQKIKGLFEEKYKSYDLTSEGSLPSPQAPFDDKEFIEKIKGVLTPEQYSKFDEYLKERERAEKTSTVEPTPKEEKEKEQK